MSADYRSSQIYSLGCQVVKKVGLNVSWIFHRLLGHYSAAMLSKQEMASKGNWNNIFFKISLTTWCPRLYIVINSQLDCGWSQKWLCVAWCSNLSSPSVSQHPIRTLQGASFVVGRLTCPLLTPDLVQIERASSSSIAAFGLILCDRHPLFPTRVESWKSDLKFGEELGILRSNEYCGYAFAFLLEV